MVTLMGLLEWLLGEEPSIFDQIGHDDKGEYAEYMIEYAVSHNNIGGYTRVLKNVYLPSNYGKTTEIDVILLTEKFIFVYESKNYSGWIFGSADQKYWTQCLVNKEKNKFYNPIMQNETHIKALCKLLQLDRSKFKSMIVFSERCELKKIPDDTEQVMIFKRKKTIDRTNETMWFEPKLFSEKEIEKIYDILHQYENVSDEIKQKHIESIKK